MTFPYLSRDTQDGAAAAALRERQVPLRLRDHWAAAELYEPSDELLAAVNAALVVGAPLLVTGQPGTGKTQLAYYLARKIRGDQPPYTLFVRSDSKADHLLYTFDAVAYFHAAYVER